MSDPGRFADELVLKLMAAHWIEAPPREPGRLMLDRIEEVLKTEGLNEVEHRQQVFARTLTRARRLLGQGLKPPDLGVWLRSLVDQTLGEYLCERVETNPAWILALLDGDESLGDDPLAHEQWAMALVHQAIAALPATYRQFLELDIVQLVALEEIQEILGFARREEIVRFKKGAFEALRNEILAHGNKRVDSHSS